MFIRYKTDWKLNGNLIGIYQIASTDVSISIYFR